ncbi:hypothetical protein NADFUDRAFT_52837 [Nadsonia fulvescens var. elongata DSM 6958]|uniref:Uncharacterized protein n=1 Tax=Nadsonia fulvescens var. elongata DSM 6958 TaxID=857566 RepID=A0A1E3PEL4_9ASCO|nr:hypothetical protein NADFUDRAFT_52837 [Nadsonia fulvescens var. elongata DSM 6958]
MVASLVSQVSQGLVDARQSSIPSSQAAAEISSLMKVITDNSDISNLLTSAINVVVVGINTSNIVQLAQQAMSSYSAFSDSSDYSTVQGLISASGTNYNLNEALTNVKSNLSPMFAVVTPQIAALPQNSQVDNAVNSIMVLGEGVISSIGSAVSQSPEITSISLSQTGGQISDRQASQDVTSALADASTTTSRTSSLTSPSLASASSTSKSEADARALKGAFAFGGLAIAVANYLL